MLPAPLNRSPQGRHAWLQYVTVESADHTAARAKELGAAIGAEPFDVPGIGRMAMLTDPAGEGSPSGKALGGCVYYGPQEIQNVGRLRPRRRQGRELRRVAGNRVIGHAHVTPGVAAKGGTPAPIS